IVDRYKLSVSPKTPPQSMLRIGVSMFQRGGPALRYLDYRLAGGNSGVTYVFGAIRVGGQAAVPNIAFAPSNLRFGAGIELLSVSPADTIWSPGDALRVVLQWKALAPVSRRYTVFVHLLDSANKVVAQSDAQPRGNTYPTTLWQRSCQILWKFLPASGRELGGDVLLPRRVGQLNAAVDEAVALK
ncbi:MAG: hypothetical protein ACRDF8_08025, partial [Chloroflexota bacterium]